jgi:glycosyltransferase involved in cell wall biosynthesis
VEHRVLPLAEAARDYDRRAVGARGAPVRDILAYVRVLRRTIRAERPAVVHTNSMKSHVYGGLAAFGTGVAHVAHVHDRISTDFMSRGGVLLMRTVLRLFPRGIVVNSTATARTVAVAHKQMLILPCPIEPPAAVPERAERPLTVGVVGRIARWKGQDLAIRAFAEVFPAGPERLLVVGGPQFGEHELLSELKALAAELGVAERVEFTGHVTDTYAQLARMDVLLHTSVIPEPFGQVVVEGMAAGLPVVAAAAGGPLEIIDDGRDGLLYPPRDLAALTAALKDLAGDPTRRARMGEAATVSARRYAPERVVPVLEEFYERVRG